MENNIDEEQIEEVEEKRPRQKTKLNIRWGWAIKILFITLLISFCFGVLSEMLLSTMHSVAGTVISILLLFLFILIAVICDMIGVAVAGADIEPFMAMASKKVKGAKQCISLIKNADKASSFFCDIIGDACGILCGSIGAVIVSSIAISGDVWQVLVSGLASAIIAALTVFGKAVGKSIAVSNANKIVLKVGKILSIFKSNKK
jgi:hypothetical protein